MNAGVLALIILGIIGLLGAAVIFLMIAASIPYDHR